MNEKILNYALLFINQEIESLEVTLSGNLSERDRELLENRKDELIHDRSKIETMI
jgi:hypothetical protein